MNCKCGKHMLQRGNDGTCLWCGHGTPATPGIYTYADPVERSRYQPRYQPARWRQVLAIASRALQAKT